MMVWRLGFGMQSSSSFLGVAKMRVAILCAEKDPLDCHRCILVSPWLKERGINVLHIHDDGTLESQEQAEHRLAQMFNRAERELFGAPDELVAEAYRLQGEKIAYDEEHPGMVGRATDAGQTRLCQ